MSNAATDSLSITEVFTEDVKARVEEAIRLAEQNTSGELRVHLEDLCPEDPLDRASFIFSELEMHRTDQRNGVLIYLAMKDRKTAIIGDVGINLKMEKDSWDAIRQHMTAHFQKGEYEAGIVDAVHRVGEKIRAFFPIEVGDRNELTNQISTKDFRRPA